MIPKAWVAVVGFQIEHLHLDGQVLIIDDQKLWEECVCARVLYGVLSLMDGAG